MARERPALGTPFGTDGPWLQEIVNVLGDLHDLLDARLPQPVHVQVRPVSEPAPDAPPASAAPVTEPAPDGPPNPDEHEDEDDEGDVPPPEPVTEPAPDEAPLPDPPPRAGRGSGLEAWQAFADLAEVPYAPDDTRNEIIAACIRAGVIGDA